MVVERISAVVIGEDQDITCTIFAEKPLCGIEEKPPESLSAGILGDYEQDQLTIEIDAAFALQLPVRLIQDPRVGDEAVDSFHAADVSAQTNGIGDRPQPDAVPSDPGHNASYDIAVDFQYPDEAAAVHA